MEEKSNGGEWWTGVKPHRRSIKVTSQTYDLIQQRRGKLSVDKFLFKILSKKEKKQKREIKWEVPLMVWFILLTVAVLGFFVFVVWVISRAAVVYDLQNVTMGALRSL